MIEILVILNITINLFLLYYLFWDRFEIEFRRTFFGKVPFGIDLWLWNKDKIEAIRIIGFNFREEDKIQDYPYIKTRYNSK